jgi:hypothetical protein
MDEVLIPDLSVGRSQRRPAESRCRGGVLAGAGLVVAMMLASTLGVAQEVRVNAHAAMLQRFAERVDAYLEVRRDAKRGLPPLTETDDPADINNRERQLADAIRDRRRHANRGDVFGPDMGTFVRHTVRAYWNGLSLDERRALMEDMPKRVPPVVNMAYPPGLPLVTTPPDVLEALPDLPEGLEYRLYSRHVILRDAEAGLIVDLLDNVVRW